ncbi:MAG: response regulator [Blastocatellia bacterium]
MNSEKILLVENNSTYCDSVKKFLEQYGYQVITADAPEPALEILPRESPKAAVIDVRLRDDADEKDVSGILLAKEIDSAVPVIILTDYPTYEAVREAMAPTLDGHPPAVGFVAKQEGLYKLLSAIQLALARLNRSFEKKLLEAFDAPGLFDLQKRVVEFGNHASGGLTADTVTRRA